MSGINKGGRPYEGTPENKHQFLMNLRQVPFWGMAAEMMGKSERTIKRWREDDPEFDADCVEMRAFAREAVEFALMKQATGIQEPVVSGGKLVKNDNGHVLYRTKYSTAAAQLFLRGHDPDRYNTKRVDATVRPGAPVPHEQISEDAIDETEAIQDYMQLLDHRPSQQE